MKNSALNISTLFFAKYFPFGMLMPNRSENASQYRYGFQGQEKDDETKGQGNSINYKYRMHDPRVGRFFSVDPLTAKYPYYSPYAFSGNRVIDSKELEGAEPDILNATNMAWLYIKWSIASWGNELNGGIAQYSEGDKMMNKENPKGVQMAGLVIKTEGAKRIANQSLKAMETSAEVVASVPVIDVVGDPIMASYYANKGDYQSAISYTVGASVPFFGGAVFKYGGKALASTFKRLESLPKASQSTVDNFVEIFKKNEGWGDIDKIDVFEMNGEKYILNGHNRVAAAKKANIEVEYNLVSEDQLSSYGYNSAEEVISASSEVTKDKIK